MSLSINDYLEELLEIRDRTEELSSFCHLPGLEDEELISKTLPLANNGSSMEQMVEGYFVAAYSSLIESATTVPEATREGVSTEEETKRRVVLFLDDTRASREQFNDALDRILENRERAREQLQPYVRDGLRQLVLVPKLRWDGGTSRMDIQYCPLKVDGVFGYVVMLLLDRSKNYGEHLRRCKLSSCDGIFHARSAATGGPRRLYCSKDHYKESVRLTGAQRMRDSWARKQETARSKRQRRG